MQDHDFRLQAKGISRIDDPGRHGVGWYARVTFRGDTYSKYFADSAHGGTAAAFGKAKAWRNAKEKELGKPRTDRLVPATSSRSRTGIPGVYRTKNSYVVAWSPESGQVERKLISITRYGVEEAFRLAVELRRKRERALYGKPVTTLDQGHPVNPPRRRKKVVAATKRRKRRPSR